MPKLSRKVVVLPDAGPENPFQYELVRYLRQQGMVVNVGTKYPLGSTFRALQQHQPDIIYYDWVHSFILGKSLLWSWIKSLIFVLEIMYTRFFYRAKLVQPFFVIWGFIGYVSFLIGSMLEILGDRKSVV